MNSKITRTFTVTSADVDFQEKLRISSFVNMFIQVAWQHSELLDFGFEKLKKMNFAWVLSRFIIEFYSLPKWGEQIELCTWAKGINRLFYRRDAQAKTTENKIFANVTSDWLIIDKTSRRPKLLDAENPVLYENEQLNAINENSPGLCFNSKFIKQTEIQVLYSDIDINQHLTARRYIDYVFNMFTPEELNHKVPKRFAVNFLQEVKYNEKIVMMSCFNKGKHFFELASADKKKSFFKAELSF